MHQSNDILGWALAILASHLSAEYVLRKRMRARRYGDVRRDGRGKPGSLVSASSSPTVRTTMPGRSP